MTSPLLEAVGEAATQCTPGMDHGPSPGGTYACQGYHMMGYCDANPKSVEPPW